MPSRSSAAPSGSSGPSSELLEFLGEFSDGTGGWIDPLELDDADAADAATTRSGDD